MLEGQSIICFAHDWGGDPTSKTHIMRILSRRNRVLWVNSIGMRRPNTSRADLGRIVSKLRRSFAKCREVEPNLFVASPLAIPFPGVPAADRFNAWLLAEWIRRLCARHEMRSPILWSFLPTIGHMMGNLGERMVVYHCVDEYSAFSGVSRESLVRMERDLVSRSDLVLTSSETLASERRSLNPNTYFVTHGVDVAHFSRALDPSTAIPEDLGRLPHPIIGFIGLLADWVDIEMIRAVALSRPGWSVALIGKQTTDLRSLQGIPNVHLLGQKPYDELPGYCRGIDAGIIPFRINRLTLRSNPLKLREYFAAGLPVVSTPLPEVERYLGLVRVAGEPEQFIAQIEQALEENTAADRRQRVEAMAGESWEARVAEISSLIGARLGAAA